MDYENILYAREEHVVTVTINRPEVHNCINRATNLELQHAWKAFRDDLEKRKPKWKDHGR